LAVVSVVLGQQGDQRSGVEQDAAVSHARSLPCGRGWCSGRRGRP
jgi:hypothetical protein